MWSSPMDAQISGCPLPVCLGCPQKAGSMHAAGGWGRHPLEAQASRRDNWPPAVLDREGLLRLRWCFFEGGLLAGRWELCWGWGPRQRWLQALL